MLDSRNSVGYRTVTPPASPSSTLPAAVARPDLAYLLVLVEFGLELLHLDLKLLVLLAPLLARLRLLILLLVAHPVHRRVAARTQDSDVRIQDSAARIQDRAARRQDSVVRVQDSVARTQDSKECRSGPQGGAKTNSCLTGIHPKTEGGG